MFHKCEGVLDVDAGATDIFFNLINSRTQPMNKGVPLGSGHEKNLKSLQNFIKVVT